MTLSLDIPTELRNRLQEEANRRGMIAEDLARMLLEQSLILPKDEKKPIRITATPGQWLEAFNAWMDNHDPTLPPLPDEAISRESIYRVRD